MAPLPLISTEELSLHNKSGDCWVTLFNRKVYDVTSFLDEHPGGGGLILEYAGKDVTEIMADIPTHEHSESAYEILDEEYHIGYLATPEETAELLKNKRHTVEVVPDSIDLTEFGNLPSEKLLSVKTDYEQDIVKHKFLDLKKPLLMQVLRANWTKEFYLDQVHRPRHYGKGSAPLFGNFLEPLSLTAWWVVPTIWLPVNFAILFVAYKNQPLYLTAGFWALGLFVWTFIEYLMHRFLFHLDKYLPENQFAFMIHFLLHGIHHYLPMDRYRLVMPPTLLLALCFPFYKLVFSVFPYYMACAGFAGGFLGYIMYDVTHYVLHHTQLPKYFQDLKTYHLEHHYKNYELGFGVTSKFWDTVFGTELTPDSIYQKRS